MTWKPPASLYDSKKPKGWQALFVGVLTSLSGHRPKPDTNAYSFEALSTCLMIYVDGRVTIGGYPNEAFPRIQERVLLGATGELKLGETCESLGRLLKHYSDSRSLISKENYIEDIREEHGLTNEKQTSVP